MRSQVTLSGRIEKIVEAVDSIRQEGFPEAIRWMIDRWIDVEGEDYLQKYGMSLSDFVRTDPKVVELPAVKDDSKA